MPRENTKPDGPVRDPDGKWVKGGPSPNPGGRPASEKEIVELARQGSAAAMRRLISIAENSPDEGAATKAAQVVLDRAYGKAKERITGGDDSDKPLRLEIASAALLDRLKKIEADAAEEAKKAGATP